MFRYVFVVFLTIAAAEPACEGDHCKAHDGSTAGSVMLQVSSAKSLSKLNDAEGEQEDLQIQMGEDSDSEAETDAEAETDEEIEEQDLEAAESDENESLEAKTSEQGEVERPRKGRGRKNKNTQQSDEDKAACPGGGRVVDGKCWHLSLPGASCEETCVEKDLQYDEATDLKEVAKKRLDEKGLDEKGLKSKEAWGMCLGIAAKFGYPGKKPRFNFGSPCGCGVFKVPAYGVGEEVFMGMAPTSAKCVSGTINARLCACKKAGVIGDSCKVSSGCGKSYCKSGTCTTLIAQDKACTEHESCTTGYCSPTEGSCTTLAWKPPAQGAFARHYFKSGARRLQYRKVPNWSEMTVFPKGFCLSYKEKTTGCLIARGVNKKKTIAKAKQRCAQSAECRAVWCCATGCPAVTCHATRAEAPNYKSKDCPDAPGSFHESKYANSFYVKDAAAPPASEKPEPIDDIEENPEPDEGEDEADKSEKLADENEPEPPAPEKDDKDAADKNDADPAQEEEEQNKIYKLVKSSSACRWGKRLRFTKLKGEETVDECAEAVKQRNGLAFAFSARKKRCSMVPKPWSECPKFRKGPFDLYELVPGARDEEPIDELEENPEPDEGEDDADEADKAEKLADENEPEPPAPEKDDEDAADENVADPAKEEEEKDKIYKLVKSSSFCRFGKRLRYTKLKGEETVDECAEAVKQRNGLAFAFSARKKQCSMAPKPWSACPKFRKGHWDLYELEPGAGDEKA